MIRLDEQEGIWYTTPFYLAWMGGEQDPVWAFTADCPAGSGFKTRNEETMPTMKTKKSATKRIKMSATGKVMRSQGGKSHLNGYKPRGRKRNLRGTTVAQDVFVKTAVRMLQGN